jgi:hypothetical protein
MCPRSLANEVRADMDRVLAKGVRGWSSRRTRWSWYVDVRSIEPLCSVPEKYASVPGRSSVNALLGTLSTLLANDVVPTQLRAGYSTPPRWSSQSTQRSGRSRCRWPRHRFRRASPTFCHARAHPRHIAFAPYHMNTMFGARPATSATACCTPTSWGRTAREPRAFAIYRAASADSTSGAPAATAPPGISFIPGYNAAYQALDDLCEC